MSKITYKSHNVENISPKINKNLCFFLKKMSSFIGLELYQVVLGVKCWGVGSAVSL